MAGREAWVNSIADREVEFKQAMEGIKGMMAAIEESPLYEFEVDGEPLLKSLHERMADFVAFPEDPENYPYVEKHRLRWIPDVELMKQGDYDPTQTGPLYEYYFGYPPKDDDYKKISGIKFPG